MNDRSSILNEAVFAEKVVKEELSKNVKFDELATAKLGDLRLGAVSVQAIYNTMLEENLFVENVGIYEFWWLSAI